MAILDLYNASKTYYVVQARQIPSIPPNFFDRKHQFLAEFKLNEQPQGPTQYTPAALDEFNTLYKALVRPPGFGSNTTPLMQWNPNSPYFKVGTPRFS